MLVVLVPRAQYSATLIQHVTETSGQRSEGDQDFKFKHSYSSSKCSLKNAPESLFPCNKLICCCCCLKSESPEGKIDGFFFFLA